jgi:hypothetical protein
VAAARTGVEEGADWEQFKLGVQLDTYEYRDEFDKCSNGSKGR